MEEIVKEPSSATAKKGKSTSKLLRYPLRSSLKAKEDKPPLSDASIGSASNSRARTASAVSKSVGVLDISGKEKSAKPPRRMSIPTRSSASPAQKLVGNLTPVSEARTKKSAASSVKSDPSVSDISRSATRRNFNRLSSAPYWISQIKLSESMGKHSVSLGFFSLALEAECEPLQLLRDELKSYVHRHNLAEFRVSMKELFESYNISEKLDHVQVSKTCSFVPEDETRSSDDDVRSSSSITSIQKQKLATSRTTAATEADQVNDMNKETTQKNSSGSAATEADKLKDLSKERSQKNSSRIQDSKKETSQKNDSTTKTRKSVRTHAANSRPGLRSGGVNTQKKMQKPEKQESKETMKKVNQQGKISDEEGPIDNPPAEKLSQENKENMDEAETEELSEVEV